ncbi:MAG: porin family protein [Ferruginibacter sp.]
MKLKLALLIIFSGIYFLSQAQKIQYGLTTALNLATISGAGISPRYQTGFEAGIFAAIPINKKISVQPELLYDFIKISRADNFTTYYVDRSRSSSKTTFNVAYASIPVLINYRVSQKISVNAGPQYNILVYSNEDLLYYNRAFTNNDFGIRGGAQFAPSPTLNLFVSYYYGIANTNAIDNGDNNYKWENRQLQIGLSIALFTAK